MPLPPATLSWLLALLAPALALPMAAGLRLTAPGLRPLALLLVAPAVLAQVALWRHAAQPLNLPPLLVGLVALNLPLVALAAGLLAAPAIPGLRPALAGLGVSPIAYHRRVTLRAQLPALGFALLAGGSAGLAAWALAQALPA